MEQIVFYSDDRKGITNMFVLDTTRGRWLCFEQEHQIDPDVREIFRTLHDKSRTLESPEKRRRFVRLLYEGFMYGDGISRQQSPSQSQNRF